jgi:hypothetical protein
MHPTDGAEIYMNLQLRSFDQRVRRGLSSWGLVILLSTPAMAQAQLAWESPQFLRPGSPAGWSFLFVDYGLDPFPGRGGAVIYRTDVAPRGLGFRGSVAQGLGDKLNFAGGVDLTASLLRATGDFPLDLMWVSGAGATYGEYTQVAVPLGVAGGRTLSAEKIWFNPYSSARAVLEGRIGDSAPEGDFSLALAIDLGADLALGRSRNFLIRMAVSMGDRNAAAIGMHLGGNGLNAGNRVSPLRRVP